MENDLKDFMERIKDEFKKVRLAIEDLKKALFTIEERLTKLEGQRKEPEDDKGWF